VVGVGVGAGRETVARGSDVGSFVAEASDLLVAT
jgi:hypothetical protein